MKAQLGCVLGLFTLLGFVAGCEGTWSTAVNASYRGMEVRGIRDNKGRWEYIVVTFTSPQSVNDVSVSIGDGSPVPISKLTMELLEKCPANPIVLPKTASVKKVGNERRMIPAMTAVIVAASDFDFRDGVIQRASFGPDTYSRCFTLVKDGKRFKLPVSQGEFESLFGKPVRTQFGMDMR